ncbi:hypothetical protein CMUS01_11436 [Colletotrichum musicola]|uniref:Uncharacterized protein n=1 Tax=Colletotrichum musicola TaxID=2175873 RepID=A0A8H6JYS1_9PEZI|nr:hypothetical protein CMUS01_11436 [Colletotrichum musicola]
MFSSQLFVLFLGLLFPACVHSESRFRRPPGPGPFRDFRDNPSYVRGEYLDISWDMDFTSAKLVLWQEFSATKLDHVVLQENTTQSEYKWHITYEGFVNPALSSIYYLELVQEGKEMANWAVTSHYFNMTDPKPATTSTTASATPSSTATTQAAGPATDTAAPAATTTEAAAKPEGGLTVGAALGVGIGATLAVILLIGVAGWMIIRRRSKRRDAGEQDTQAMTPGNSSSYHAVYGYDSQVPQQMGSPPPPSEWKSVASPIAADSRQLYEVQDNSVEVRHEMHADTPPPPVKR